MIFGGIDGNIVVHMKKSTTPLSFALAVASRTAAIYERSLGQSLLEKGAGLIVLRI